MVRKGIGVVLVVVAAVIAFMLVTGGGPLIPHIVGPITLTVIGVVLLVWKKNPTQLA